MIKPTLLLTLLLASLASAEMIDFEKHIYDQEQMFKNIDDVVGLPDLRFAFRVTNWFITGIERGLYNDTSLIINSDCFGDQLATKINEIKFIVDTNPFGEPINNGMPVLSLVYQIYYMLTTKCGMLTCMNDFMMFCWYRGCQPIQVWEHIEAKFLYVLRNINDAAIVWYTRVPESYESDDDIETWVTLAETTGQAAAHIFIDLTGFFPITKEMEQEW